MGTAYPEAQHIKKGINILTEQDWPAAFGGKFGALFVGIGAIVKDIVHFWGGKGSCKLTTGASIGNLSEVKSNLPNIAIGKKIIAFEQKFIPDLQFGANTYHFGIEDRKSVSPFSRGHIRYTVTGDVLEYESAENVFTPLPTSAILDRPGLSAVDGAGDRWAWARLVVDFTKGEYVSFEYSGVDGYRIISMKGIKLPTIATGDTITSLLVFGFGTTPAATATVYYTTDWFVAKLSSTDI